MAINIVSIIHIFSETIPNKQLYVKIMHIVIITVAIIGFIILLIPKFIFIFFFKIYIEIKNQNIWLATVAKAAPAVPPKINISGFIFTNIVFKISLIIELITNAIAGIIVLPSPCSTALMF